MAVSLFCFVSPCTISFAFLISLVRFHLSVLQFTHLSISAVVLLPVAHTHRRASMWSSSSRGATIRWQSRLPGRCIRGGSTTGASWAGALWAPRRRTTPLSASAGRPAMTAHPRGSGSCKVGVSMTTWGDSVVWCECESGSV